MLPALKFCVIIIFIGSCYARAPRNRTCKVTKNQVEVCAMDVALFGHRNAKYPSNMEEAWKLCEKIKNGLNCVSKYRFCVHGFRRSLLGSMVSVVRSAVKGVCNEEILPLFIEQTRCLTKQEVNDEFIKCVDRHVIMTDHVLEGVPSSEQFSAICCANAYFRYCNKRFTEDVCAPIVGDEAAKFLDHLIVKLSSGLPLCAAKYESIRGCAANLPGPNKRFAQVASQRFVPSQNHTPLLTFIEILGN